MENELENDVNNTAINGEAIAGMILGMISLSFCCWTFCCMPFLSIFAIPFGIGALILGIKGVNKSKKLPRYNGKGMGIVGICFGTTGILISVISIVLIVVAIIGAGTYDSSSYNSYNSILNYLD